MTEHAPRSPADCDSVAHVVVESEALARQHDVLALDPAAHHHLSRVLRVRDGEIVTLTDGTGHWVESVVGKAFAAGGLERTSETFLAPRRPTETEVVFALTKGDKPEWVVQKLTELGIARIVVLTADRSVVRWDDEKTARNLGRFRVIAREAVQQSRQVWLPVVASAGSLDAFVSSGPGSDRRWVSARCDRAGEPVASFLAFGPGPPVERVSLVIGPEGGWTDRERSLLTRSVHLADPVLRAETAAVVAGVVLAGVA